MKYFPLKYFQVKDFQSRHLLVLTLKLELILTYLCRCRCVTRCGQVLGRSPIWWLLHLRSPISRLAPVAWRWARISTWSSITWSCPMVWICWSTGWSTIAMCWGSITRCWGSITRCWGSIGRRLLHHRGLSTSCGKNMIESMGIQQILCVMKSLPK